MPRRRDLLKGFGGAALLGGLPGVSFAQADTESKLVVVILRGAVDGLAMLAPYGDAGYRGARGQLAIAPPGTEGGLLKLDGFFGLHPSFSSVHDLYLKRQALAIHAVATPYRSRSHFDAQNLLENGTSRPGGSRDGWLNRALEPMRGTTGRESAIAMAQTTPLVLRGSQAVTSWSPSSLPDADEETLQRIERLYANDEFFSSRLQQALDSQKIAGDSMGSRKRRNKLKQSKEMMQATAKFLKAPNGPRVAVIESGGWDTHSNQGAHTGSLANKFKDLDSSLNEFQIAMGDEWSSTAVLLVTEFGRTVKVNGTRGTDHGTASAALLMGGAINGGSILADWPGLKAADLYEGRDLQPTLDMRGVFKGVLSDHMGVDNAFLESRVFPDSRTAKSVEGLIAKT